MTRGICAILLIVALMIVMPGRGFGQSFPFVPLRPDDSHLMWAQIGGAGGSLSGIFRDDKPIRCGSFAKFGGQLGYPVLHPTPPPNPDGTPADCTRPISQVITVDQIAVPGAMTGEASAFANWFFPGEGVSPNEVLFALKLGVRATVNTVETGCDSPNGPCLAEVDSGVSYYAENINCNCTFGDQVKLNLGLFGGAQAGPPPSFVGVLVITASEVDRQEDSFPLSPGILSEGKSTKPLRVGPSGQFSIFINFGALQQGKGTAEGSVYVNPRAVVVASDKRFDPPGSTGTTPRADSDPTLDPSTGFNALAGWYTTSSGATQGFEVLPNGTIKAPIIDPNDNLHSTAPLGINNAGTIVGQYENVSGGINTFHGFMLSSGGTFSTYDIGIPGVSTGIQAINNNGDFAGDFGSNTQITQGFLNSGGKTVTFGVPGLNTFSQAMNDSKTIVGVYLDKSGNYQSFQRTVDGTLTTFNFPGAVSTHAEGINNAGTINGYFTDTAGKTHGFFGPLGLFLQYDLTGTAGSFGRGINNAGAVTGSFADSSGVQHGFEAQLCAPDVTSKVTVTPGAIKYDSTIRESVQKITLTNTGPTPITGPLYVLFKNLPAGVFPANQGSGVSICMAPETPLIKVHLSTPVLSPGGTATKTVHFFDASMVPITYTASVLSGHRPP